MRHLVAAAALLTIPLAGCGDASNSSGSNDITEVKPTDTAYRARIAEFSGQKISDEAWTAWKASMDRICAEGHDEMLAKFRTKVSSSLDSPARSLAPITLRAMYGTGADYQCPDRSPAVTAIFDEAFDLATDPSATPGDPGGDGP